jgi:hypothetical protein
MRTPLQIFRLSLKIFCWLLPISVGLADEPIDFNRDVRPILSNNCFFCHGHDPSHREGDLRLDIPQSAIGTAIVPGKPDESELIARITATDADELMPPVSSNKKLTEQQQQILRRWIAQGAEYQLHWSYQPPEKTAIAAEQHPVDYLVRQRLQARGLQLSPEADRRTLIRRLYLDLTGLPPKPEQVARFIGDDDPAAYANLVNEVLQSPHYGERMAQGWLDVVRFADTIGYHSDNPRNVWPYRDWVIQSFNDNKPFDRFTIEQIAGDLLPDANQESQVGSAFNRLLLSTEEGGAQPKDYEQRMLTDRVRAIGTVWLGQTIGCCQCHDHKFDPLTMRDFYSMGAFFADISEPIIGRREDGMLVLDEAAREQLKDMSTQLDKLKNEFARPRPELEAAQHAWERAALESWASSQAWDYLKPVTAKSLKQNITLKTDSENVIHAAVDGKRDARQQNDGTDVYVISVQHAPAGTTGFRIETLKEKSAAIGLAANGSFVLSEVEIFDGDRRLEISQASATFEHPESTASQAIDGISDQSPNGWGVLGATGSDQALYLELTEPLAEKVTKLTFSLTFAAGENLEAANLRLSSTHQAPPIVAPSAPRPSPEIAALLQLSAPSRTPEQQRLVSQAFKEITPELGELRTQIAAAEKAKADFERSAPRCIVSVSSPDKRTVRILPRGNWMDESGEMVQPAVPQFLPQPVIEGREPNRLDLAQWIVSRDNPLTARTVMNRLWKQLFGAGLSRVLDDLGAQGEPPHYPELLDWLACEFMDSGWDYQHMVRTIVLSATYKQSSSADDEALTADPYNHQLARQSPFRLDAELIRDGALSVSGLLVPTLGGPSVKPYQPADYWDNLNFPQRTYIADSGAAQYRRGLYTWWQRSFLHPSLLAFDAPNREECCAERNRSNIPQQALVLLNDPTYVEAARVFAARILTEMAGDDQQRLTWAWQQALQRQPTLAELDTLLAVLQKRRTDYQQDKAAAEALLQVGHAKTPEAIDPIELAAWTHVTRILLNLHEMLTRS